MSLENDILNYLTNDTDFYRNEHGQKGWWLAERQKAADWALPEEISFNNGYEEGDKLSFVYSINFDCYLPHNFRNIAIVVTAMEEMRKRAEDMDLLCLRDSNMPAVLNDSYHTNEFPIESLRGFIGRLNNIRKAMHEALEMANALLMNQ